MKNEHFIILIVLIAFISAVYIAVIQFSQAPSYSDSSDSLKKDQQSQPKHHNVQCPNEMVITPLIIEAKWNSLYNRGDCLTGAQDYAGGFIGEGSVFNLPEWKQFVDLDPNLTTPFLLQFADSKEESNFHVCPFQCAYKGELVFYVLQHIHKSNWFEAPISDVTFEEAKQLHKERRQDGFRIVFENELLREDLKSFFRNKVIKSNSNKRLQLDLAAIGH